MSHYYDVYRVNEPLAHYRWHGNIESTKSWLLQIMEIEQLLHEYHSHNVYPMIGLCNIRDSLLYNKV